MEGLIPRHLRRVILLAIFCSIFFLSFRASKGGSYRSFTSSRDKFPLKIWQSWKVDPLFFEQRDIERARTWTKKNQAHRYEVLTDENALGYVEQHFGPDGINRPDIIHTYRSLNAQIIKADLLRYLIMYAEGGVYADIDVEAIRSVNHFIPNRYDERDIDMVIGVETDEPDFQTHPVLGPKAQSFCQWTFMCKPRLPVMMRLIEDIMKWLNELSQKQNKPIGELELDFNEVLSGTGPSAFTAAILADMTVRTGQLTTWESFHDLEESEVVGGVLVLTAEAFAAGTGHSDSGNHGGRGALVKHHFHASSWTTHHPRYKHPIYGEVEKCNWDPECVKLWDANTAFFESLTKEEQIKLIALKEIDEESTEDVVFNIAEVGMDLNVPPAGPPQAVLPEAAAPAIALPLPQGELSPGELPLGELPLGELPPGGFPLGEPPSGELPLGELPPGELPLGQLPSGELPPGELPPAGLPEGLHLDVLAV